MGLFAIAMAVPLADRLISVPSRYRPLCDTQGARLVHGRLEIAVDPRSHALNNAGMLLASLALLATSLALKQGHFESLFPDAMTRDIRAAISLLLGVSGAVVTIRSALNRAPALVISGVGCQVPKSNIDLPWADIERVRPSPLRGDNREGWWVSLVPDRRSDEIRVDDTCLGPLPTFWLMDFYHRHPELRDELSDARVLRRLRDGSLVEQP